MQEQGQGLLWEMEQDKEQGIVMEKGKEQGKGRGRSRSRSRRIGACKDENKEEYGKKRFLHICLVPATPLSIQIIWYLTAHCTAHT